MKVVLLGTDCASTWMMVNVLKVDYPDIHVVIENQVSRYVLLKRRAARLGFVKVIGQIFFMLYLPLLKKLSNKRIQSLIASADLSTAPPLEVEITRLESVNSQACIEWLKVFRPLVVVLNGTRIVSTSLLKSCDAVFLNTHCGITPAYRGVHGAYWALVSGDIDNVGVTVHLVDAGIDTGSIVSQVKIDVCDEDNFVTYPVKQYIAGIPLMRSAITNALGNNLISYPRTDLTSALWHHPTLWGYFSARFFRGVR